jgi:hypothetical protein
MGSPISRRPQGLLDLLLAQQQGANPGDLRDDVSSTLDLFEFYAVERMAISATGTAIAAVDGQSSVTVPATEAWRLIAVSGAWTWATANQDLKLSLQIRNVSGTNMHLSTGELRTSTGVSDKDAQAFVMPVPILLPSGSQLRLIAQSLNLDGQASISVTNSVLHTRMQV